MMISVFLPSVLSVGGAFVGFEVRFSIGCPSQGSSILYPGCFPRCSQGVLNVGDAFAGFGIRFFRMSLREVIDFVSQMFFSMFSGCSQRWWCVCKLRNSIFPDVPQRGLCFFSPNCLRGTSIHRYRCFGGRGSPDHSLFLRFNHFFTLVYFSKE